MAKKKKNYMNVRDRDLITVLISVAGIIVFAVLLAIWRNNFVIKTEDNANSSITASTTATSSADKSGKSEDDANSSITASTTATSSSDKSGNATAVEGYDGYVPPEIDTTKTYYADIVIKGYGKITVKLEADDAPMTVANFVDLVSKGFYNGLTFHRIDEGFMMQGGDPNGNGTGGPGHTIFGEFESNGFANDLKHTRGAISMARSQDRNSAGSQFFIMHEDNTYLDGDYAVFGYVTEGMDIVDAICEEAKPIDGNCNIAADEQPVIESVTIRME